MCNHASTVACARNPHFQFTLNDFTRELTHKFLTAKSLTNSKVILANRNCCCFFFPLLLPWFSTVEVGWFLFGPRQVWSLFHLFPGLVNCRWVRGVAPKKRRGKRELRGSQLFGLKKKKKKKKMVWFGLVWLRSWGVLTCELVFDIRFLADSQANFQLQCNNWPFGGCFEILGAGMQNLSLWRTPRSFFIITGDLLASGLPSELHRGSGSSIPRIWFLFGSDRGEGSRGFNWVVVVVAVVGGRGMQILWMRWSWWWREDANFMELKEFSLHNCETFRLRFGDLKS